MKTISDSDAAAPLVRFDREFFDPQQRMKIIGGGQVGGKARGLALADRVLSTRFAHDAFRRIEISIPSLTVLCSDVFDDFIRRNELEAVIESSEQDDAIARAFQRGDLPAGVVGDLRALIEQVHSPLAIRSSSLLEDELAQPFAGVYETKMIPNNQPAGDERFRRLDEAIKFVWASTFFRDARAYLAATGETRRDRMAVIIQEVVGTRFRDRFYPHLAGVARSYNHYPSGHATPADGVVSLALGLGKTIVDGGVCWTYSPAYPAAPAPFASAAALAAGTQTRFWAVNMGKPPAYDPIRETEYLLEGALADAEEDGTLERIASTFDRESGRIRMGTGTSGPRVLDFAMLLALRDVPINDLVRSLLHLFEDEVGAAVEIEFAATFDPHRFGLLQVRPMMTPSEMITVEEDELSSERAVIASTRVAGNGAIETIRDVVYVRPSAAGPMNTRAIAAEIEQINAALLRERKPYLLIGFGRWGSSDPSLGIPVVWSQIAGARAIVEAMTPEMNVELSQGSHFFHNLASFRVPYFSVPLSRCLPVRWEWLDRRRIVSETALVKHVETAAPLRVRVDGRSGRGVILKGIDED
jgi:Pyruvate phosphate dikinase, AMP/ATP-binding domain